MTIEELRRVMVVGAGTMGQQVAFQCAGHGCDVVLYDVAPEALELAKRRLESYAAGLVDDGVIAAELRDAALARITTTTDMIEAAAEADLVNESIPEDPRLKGRVLGQLNALCPPRTIFTTNTSTLVPSQFAKASGRPERLLALHFHQPRMWVNNIADVMPHKRTAPEVTALVEEFARRIGQVPIRLHSERHGYVFNAMFLASGREALTTASKGVASVEDIDRAWMRITDMRLGMFGMFDIVGLDTVATVTGYWARRGFFIPQLRRNASFVQAYVDRGELGVKSGKGFYTYPDPAFERPDFIDAGGVS